MSYKETLRLSSLIFYKRPDYKTNDLNLHRYLQKEIGDHVKVIKPMIKSFDLLSSSTAGYSPVPKELVERLKLFDTVSR